MKKALYFALLSLCICFVSHAQTLPADSTGHVIYRGVVTAPAGVTPTQAYGRAKVWLADAFAGKGVMADDAASGLLSGGGTVIVRSMTYTFRVRMQVEPGQVRYRLDNFTWQVDGGRTPAERGTIEEQRDSSLAIGRGTRAKILAELDQKVRAGLAQLKTDLAGSL